MKTLGSTAALLFVLAAAVGCASSEVTERQSYIGDEKLSRPNRILVYDFAATPADVPADSALAGQSVSHSRHGTSGGEGGRPTRAAHGRPRDQRLFRLDPRGQCRQAPSRRLRLGRQ